MKIGIDIIQIKRLININYIMERILAPSEISIYQQFTSLTRRRQFLAGRWAAKEAITKCLGKHAIPFSLISILWDGQKLTVKNNLSLIISISHEEDYAVAVAILTD